jgi:hypothetical protein
MHESPARWRGLGWAVIPHLASFPRSDCLTRRGAVSVDVEDVLPPWQVRIKADHPTRYAGRRLLLIPTSRPGHPRVHMVEAVALDRLGERPSRNLIGEFEPLQHPRRGGRPVDVEEASRRRSMYPGVTPPSPFGAGFSLARCMGTMPRPRDTEGAPTNGGNLEDPRLAPENARFSSW